MEKDLAILNKDGVVRVYIDYFEDRDKSGLKYKG
jgi:hypothetical protein